MSEKVPKSVSEKSCRGPGKVLEGHFTIVSVVKCNVRSNTPETLSPDWFNLHFLPISGGAA